MSVERVHCGAEYPYAHLCRCDIPLDEHDDPGWHECGCGREWHDADDVTAAGCALIPSGEQRSPASGVEVVTDQKAGRGETPACATCDGEGVVAIDFDLDDMLDYDTQPCPDCLGAS